MFQERVLFDLYDRLYVNWSVVTPHSLSDLFVIFWIVYLSLSRDADETKDWIDEKNTALNTDDLGNDLHKVQALQRKHQGLERDLNALEKQVLYRLESMEDVDSVLGVKFVM